MSGAHPCRYHIRSTHNRPTSLGSGICSHSSQHHSNQHHGSHTAGTHRSMNAYSSCRLATGCRLPTQPHPPTIQWHPHPVFSYTTRTPQPSTPPAQPPQQSPANAAITLQPLAAATSKSALTAPPAKHNPARTITQASSQTLHRLAANPFLESVQSLISTHQHNSTQNSTDFPCPSCATAVAGSVSTHTSTHTAAQHTNSSSSSSRLSPAAPWQSPLPACSFAFLQCR